MGRSRQAIELSERHGWTDEPPAGLAYVVLAAGLAWQGRLEEAGDWIQRAERTVKEEAEPAAAIGVHYIRGQLELARGRDVDALDAFQTAERLAERLAAPVPSPALVLLACSPRPPHPSRCSRPVADQETRC